MTVGKHQVAMYCAPSYYALALEALSTLARILLTADSHFASIFIGRVLPNKIHCCYQKDCSAYHCDNRSLEIGEHTTSSRFRSNQ